ncbi:MAG TPA: glycosyltransferase family 2 protein [Oculatellaceae cyanobacterium]|jgi:GT2 family glycosyltransferase
MTPKVFILLLNYRGTDDTFSCLDSLRTLDYPDFEIIVIDNASPDDSVARLKARLEQNPGEFHLICSPDNRGYSAGNNLGLDYALANAPNDTAAVWLLNNDTTVESGALSALVAESKRTGGIAGSLLLYPDGSYQQVGTRLRWWTGSAKGYPEAAIRDGMLVETLTGASMLLPLQVIQKVGKLDESFFLYFEDGEYSLRCRRHGIPLTLAMNSRVFHKEGATTGRKSRMTQYFYHRNRLRLFAMYANPIQKITITLYTAFRLFRSVVKSWAASGDKGWDARISAKIQWLAVQDFCRGVSGPCPHNLEQL